MKKLLILLITLTPLFISCQNHLDRTDAKKMIIRKYNYPIKKTYDLPKKYTKDMDTQGLGVTVVLGEDKTEEIEKIVSTCESKGLLQTKEIPRRKETSSFLIGTTVRTWKEVNITLTNLGKKYLMQNNSVNYVVDLWQIDFKEITGIQELPEFNVASVDYTIYNTNITPFGSIFNDKNRISKRSVDFSLYDNGWRLD